MQNGLVRPGEPGMPRTWETLFAHVLTVVGEISSHGRDDPFWTLGGGTVLMLRYHPTFEHACGALKATLTAMLEAPPLRDDATDVDVESSDRPATPGL